jgi:hypothetical protein
MKYPINRISLHAVVEFKVYYPNQPERVFQTKGRKAQTLLCLVEVGQRGLTSEEVASWALRLASYIYDLKNHYGIDIETTLEPHNGGKHARYRLLSLVEIISITEPEPSSCALRVER